MKKILLSILTVGLISTTLMADDGKIQSIKAKSDGSVTVDLLVGEIVKSKLLIGSPEAIKTMTAMALTAKSSNADVTMFKGEGGWGVLIIK